MTAARGQKWVPKISGNGLGNPLSVNPLNDNVLYASPGSSQLYVSRNRGYTWGVLGSTVPGGGVIKSVAISPVDTSRLLLGVESGNGSPDFIVRSTNNGSTWSATWHGSFSYYGDPVEFKPAHPDTVFTMSNDTIFWSLDFGETWSVVQKVTGLFNSWCDAEARSDSGNIMFVGDNSSGIWKTTDYGNTWKNVYSTTGEIPSIAIDHHNPQIVFAAKFGDGGGMVRSTDGGEHWNVLPTPAGNGNLWWVTTSMVSPGYVYVGSYGAMTPGPFVSADYGASWRQMIAADSGSQTFSVINYSLLAVDTQTVMAVQANGLWKLQYPRGVSVVSPNGGESYPAGSVQTIAWSQTNVSMVRIELSTNGGASWSVIADSVPASPASFQWTLPLISSQHSLVKVVDLLSGYYLDISDTEFTLFVPSLSLTSPAGGEVIRGGGLYPVTWSSTGFDLVILAFSSDLGATWKNLVTAPAESAAFLWKVPSSPTSSAIVRIITPDDSLFEDESAPFAITAASEFACTLRVTDNGSDNDTLVFGAAAGASDGVDPGFGESYPGPLPGSGIFDVRWSMPGNEESLVDIRDTLSGTNAERRFTLRAQPGAAGLPMTLAWSPRNLGEGMFLLQDRTTLGRRMCVDMQIDSSSELTDSLFQGASILQCLPVTLSLPADGGWRLLSLPSTIADRQKQTLFPFATTAAYAFESGYKKRDTLDYGKGYWLKSDAISVTGCPRSHDTINVVRGWNIIGSLSEAIPVQAISTIPDSILITGFFDYDNGYSIADSIQPGRGYWVKASLAGKIILTAGSTMPPSLQNGWHFGDIVRSLSVLRISSQSGVSQKLYIGEIGENTETGAFEMPPSPPGLNFSASFDGRILAPLRSYSARKGDEFPISLSGDFSELKLDWDLYNDEKFSYILIERNGVNVLRETPISGHGGRSISMRPASSLSINVVSVTGLSESPQVFSLAQNYPNPFNPGTSIRFTVPRESYVVVRVYSLLGQTVATLLSGYRNPGVHEVEWNGLCDEGTAVSSGLYVVSLSLSGDVMQQTERGILTRKIVLLK